jgi:hypothetical protein
MYALAYMALYIRLVFARRIYNLRNHSDLATPTALPLKWSWKFGKVLEEVAWPQHLELIGSLQQSL